MWKMVVGAGRQCGIETVARRRHEAELGVAEMKMLSLSLGVTKMNTIKNENIRGRHMLDVLAVKSDRPY